MPNRDFSDEMCRQAWIRAYGDVSSAVDPFGRTITRSQRGTSWEADHKMPLARGGRTTLANCLPMHRVSNAEKSSNLSGIVNGRRFAVSGTTLTVGSKRW